VHADKQSAIGLIQRHREVAFHALQGPMGDLLCGPIYHDDLLSAGHVDVNIRSGSFQLERLRFAAQLVLFVQASIRCGVDHRDRPGLLVVAATNVHALAGRVVPQVIGASFEIKGGDWIVRLVFVDVELAAAAGHEQLVRVWRKGEPLWIGHARDGMVQDSPANVDRLDGITAQGGDEEHAPP
jgi:hypothetical protein